MEEENEEASTFFQLYDDDGGVDDSDINTYQTHDNHSFEKRRKTMTGYFRIVPKKPYSCVLQLSTGYVLRFKKKDGHDLLLPRWFESNEMVRKIVSRSLRSVAARLHYLSHIMEEEEGYDDDGNMTYYDLKEQVMESYIVETRLRKAMRNVLTRWRNHQIDKRHQDIVDPITLSEPEKQIVLYDWSMKRKFIFDAKSLSIHIETALLYHEEGFAVPCYPRNPWTNLDFTYRQLVSIYEQLKIHGELRWGFMTLRQHNFNKSMWHKYHHTSITLKAVQTSLVQLDSANARDVLEDFIIMKINEVEDVTPFLVSLYRTAITHVPRHWIIEQWKKAAFLHYESQHFGLNRIVIINRLRDTLLKKQSQLIRELTEEGFIP